VAEAEWWLGVLGRMGLEELSGRGHWAQLLVERSFECLPHCGADLLSPFAVAYFGAL
jgi:hypothetical protein